MVAVKPIIKRVIGRPGVRFINRLRSHPYQKFGRYVQALQGKVALEVGGPSGMFTPEGPLPIYPYLSTIDNCVFATETIFINSRGTDRFFYHPGRKPRHEYICDATDLREISAQTYDCLISSHCLEHVANPIRALKEWQRVVTPKGFFLFVLPDRRFTFDWRRELTPVEHMIDDYRRNVTEADLSHLEAELLLRDLSRSNDDRLTFEYNVRNNVSTRAMHHHTFELATLVELLKVCDFSVIDADTIAPYHITVLASSRS